ncbi:peroxiredoxin [Candidatus Gottesmanbacteria bacterium]|nr:peroxiredoxin [Candidatus Gottesmanbacteria bacterium]
MQLHVGDRAPEFLLVDQDGKTHSLKDYRGKRVLLYFYPKDQTPGCIREACNFRDNIDLLKKKVVVLGVSGDSVASHQAFVKKYKLNFPLLSDTKKTIIALYGTDGLVFAKRASFLISKEGKIEKIYPHVDPDTHVQEVLKDLL